MGFFCEVSFKLNQILLDYSHQFCATVTLAYFIDSTGGTFRQIENSRKKKGRTVSQTQRKKNGER